MLRADLEFYRRIGCPETSLEDAITRVLIDARVPEPELQHRVLTPGGRYRIDVAYPWVEHHSRDLGTVAE